MGVRRYDLEDLAGQLFTLLASKPDGLDIHEIADELDIPRRKSETVIRCLRLLLGGGDSINVPWRAEGKRRIYFLAGQVEQGQAWQGFRVATKISQIKVDLAWWRSMVAATDGRTREGRLSRMVLRHWERLDEDLADLGGGGAA